VPAAKVIESNYNLDIKNPNGKADLEHLQPEQLTESILKKEMRIAEIKAVTQSGEGNPSASARRKMD